MPLNVLCDESADEKKQRVFAMAGVVGTEEAWKQLEDEWIVRTRGVPFHANDCDSDRGVYTKTSHADNKAVYRDLTVLLADSALSGWAFVIDLAAQRSVFPDAPNLAYYKGFSELLAAMRNFAVSNKDSLKFTFDSRKESEYNASLLYRMFRDEGDEGRTFPEIFFLSSQTEPRLQVADLFAREAMKTYDNRFGNGQKRRPPRKSWLALRNTERFHIEAVNNAWFEDLKANMTKLQETTGMSPTDYVQWLRQQGMHDSTTNRFRYMQSKSPIPSGTPLGSIS